MNEAIAQVVDTRAAAGPRPAPLTDLLDRARAIIDHRIEIAVGGRVAEADQHGFYIDNAFQIQFRQGLILHPTNR
jgi:hypothetical protein